MLVFDVKDHFDPEFGEYVIGSRQLGRHGVYLTMGEVAQGATRVLEPGAHEEILLLVAGEAVLRGEGREVRLRPDQAVYVGPEDSFELHALADCRYVSAGGHPADHSHGHLHEHAD